MDRRFLRLRLECPPVTDLRVPTQLTLSVTTPNTWALRWTDPNITETGYRIERQLLADSSWQTLDTTPADTGDFIDTAANYQVSFTYRVSALDAAGHVVASAPVTLPDSDGDGIPDVFELGTSYTGANGTYASSANRFSSNGSGISDGWLVAHGYNPIVAFDFNADSDGDGRSDALEYLQGTDPRVADTAPSSTAIPSTAPSQPELDESDPNAIGLSWTGDVAMLGYLIERSQDNATWTIISLTRGNLTTFTDTLASRAQGQVYIYRIRGIY